MPAFARGQTHLTSTSFVEVDGLPAGTYRFQLVVDDNGGKQSLPAEAVVEVVAPTTVTQPFLRAVLEPVVRSPLINTRVIR
jgi:hypothetical protein